MHCVHCGGTIIGDGYVTVLHCESVDLPMDVEPDGDILYCEEDSCAEEEAYWLAKDIAEAKAAAAAKAKKKETGVSCNFCGIRHPNNINNMYVADNGCEDAIYLCDDCNAEQI